MNGIVRNSAQTVDLSRLPTEGPEEKQLEE
jgi:hypothetical protein